MSARQKALVDNAGDASQVREATKTEREAERQRVLDVAQVLSTKHGRRVWYELLATCGVWQGGFQPDSNRLQFDSGRRDIGLKYLHEITSQHPKDYELMMRESREESV